MTSNLSVPIEIKAVVHDIDGGGNWAEVPSFPGCVAQAETLEDLKNNMILAIGDWLAQSHFKSADEARQLAAIQGSNVPEDKSFPESYEFLPPPSWSDEDE